MWYNCTKHLVHAAHYHHSHEFQILIQNIYLNYVSAAAITLHETNLNCYRDFYTVSFSQLCQLSNAGFRGPLHFHSSIYSTASTMRTT